MPDLGSAPHRQCTNAHVVFPVSGASIRRGRVFRRESKDMSNNGGGSSWEGMNPDVVEAQARILRGLSEEVAALMNKIEGEASQLAEAWNGDDSNKFAAEWTGTHKPVFTMAATLLANMSDISQRSAGQQRATSSS